MPGKRSLRASSSTTFSSPVSGRPWDQLALLGSEKTSQILPNRFFTILQAVSKLDSLKYFLSDFWKSWRFGFFKDRPLVGLVMKKLFWRFPQHGVQGRRKQGCQISLLGAAALCTAQTHPCSARDKKTQLGTACDIYCFFFPHSRSAPGNAEESGTFGTPLRAASILPAKTVPRGAEKLRGDQNLPGRTAKTTKPYHIETTQRREGRAVIQQLFLLPQLPLPALARQQAA